MHPFADRVTELDRETPDQRKARQEATVRAIAAQRELEAHNAAVTLVERQRLLVDLLDIADGNCPDHDGGLAHVAKALYDHLSSHP